MCQYGFGMHHKYYMTASPEHITLFYGLCAQVRMAHTDLTMYTFYMQPKSTKIRILIKKGTGTRVGMQSSCKRRAKQTKNCNQTVP